MNSLFSCKFSTFVKLALKEVIFYFERQNVTTHKTGLVIDLFFNEDFTSV